MNTLIIVLFCFFKQKTAYEMRIIDWSSDVCSSDLRRVRRRDEPANLSRHSDDGLSPVRGGCRHIAAQRVCRRVEDHAAQGGGLGGLDGGRGQVGAVPRVLERRDRKSTRTKSRH